MELTLRSPVFPPIHSIPALTTEQMRAVECAMVHDFGISLVQMIENAGRSFAELARLKLGGKVEEKAIFVLAGNGNKGGGGMVATRHLANWGAWVVVILSEKPALEKTVTREQLEILQRMGIGLFAAKALGKMFEHADLILDALGAYDWSRPPRGDTADLIRRANESEQTILALDAPSGLEANSGEILEPCIRAHATLTLGLPKIGLLAPEARAVVGKLYLTDLGIPRLVYEDLGVRMPNLFAEASILQIGE